MVSWTYLGDFKREKNIPPDLTISKLNADLNNNASSSQRGL